MPQVALFSRPIGMWSNMMVNDLRSIHELLMQKHLHCHLFETFAKHVCATVNFGDDPTMPVVMLTYIKGNQGCNWNSTAGEAKMPITGDLLRAASQEFLTCIQSGDCPLSEEYPVRTCTYCVMGLWKQAIFLGMSYCHCSVAEPMSPGSAP